MTAMRTTPHMLNVMRERKLCSHCGTNIYLNTPVMNRLTSSAKAYTGRAVLYALHSALSREMRFSAKDCDYFPHHQPQPPSPNNSVQDMSI